MPARSIFNDDMRIYLLLATFAPVSLSPTLFGSLPLSPFSQNCVLFSDLSQLPSLLPSKCSAAQTQHKVKALKALYHYALRCNSCRVRQVLEYFGEEWTDAKKAQGCGTCDVCVVGVHPHVDYFQETGTLLNSIEQIASFDRQSCWTQLCRDLDGKCDRGKHFWRGLCRQLIEQGYVVDEGIPSQSQQRNSVITIACPQPTARGRAVLQAWKSLDPPPLAARPSESSILGRGASVSDAVSLGSGSSLKMPFRAPRPGLQSDLGSWRVLASLNGGPTREPAAKVLSCGGSSRVSPGTSTPATADHSQSPVMLRPEV